MIIRWTSHDQMFISWTSHDQMIIWLTSHDQMIIRWTSHDQMFIRWTSHDHMIIRWTSHDHINITWSDDRTWADNYQMNITWSDDYQMNITWSVEHGRSDKTNLIQSSTKVKVEIGVEFGKKRHSVPNCWEVEDFDFWPCLGNGSWGWCYHQSQIVVGQGPAGQSQGAKASVPRT